MGNSQTYARRRQRRRQWLRSHQAMWDGMPSITQWHSDTDPRQQERLTAVWMGMVDAGLYSKNTARVDAEIGILKHMGAVRKAKRESQCTT